LIRKIIKIILLVRRRRMLKRSKLVTTMIIQVTLINSLMNKTISRSLRKRIIKRLIKLTEIRRKRKCLIKTLLFNKSTQISKKIKLSLL
jgi:hypothetical protein